MNLACSFVAMIWKISASLLLFIGLSNTLAAQINEKIWNYILTYRAVAIEEMNRTGIPASITLAQGLLESGIGESRLATEGNNHFGIKCHDWTGPSVRHTDDAPNECFRKYNSAYESYIDHSNFLTGRKRYAVLFTYAIDDYEQWAKGLKRCGYATNPKYADLLIKKIELYYLHIFDKANWQELWAIVETNRQLSLGETYTKIIEPPTKVIVKKVIKPKVAVVKSAEPVKVYKEVPNAKQVTQAANTSSNFKQVETVNTPPTASPKTAVAKNFSFATINNLRTVTYTYPVTVADVAAAQQVKIKKLFRFNELDGFATFEAHTPIFLQNKKRVYKGNRSVHQVKVGETIERLAQLYGVKKCTLHRLNLLHPTQEPRVNELVYLKKKRKIPPKVQ